MIQSALSEISIACAELGLARPEDVSDVHPIGGGVSCDVWRVDLGDRQICAKRALPELRVDTPWSAPTRRIEKEAFFNRSVSEILPGAVPAFMGFHEKSGILFSAFLDADRYQLWKDRLREGLTFREETGAVALTLARIHIRTAKSDTMKKELLDHELFRALRLEPYFAFTAKVNSDLYKQLLGLFDLFETQPICVTHGDFSPKNIMIGPDGPVVLDAECANYGDPAFDVAFCLNHLLLKAAGYPQYTSGYSQLFTTFVDTYLAETNFEGLIDRTCAYLPALMLARVDGKSPVEYIQSPAQKAQIRSFAKEWITSAETDLQGMAQSWFAQTADQTERGSP